MLIFWESVNLFDAVVVVVVVVVVIKHLLEILRLQYV